MVFIQELWSQKDNNSISKGNFLKKFKKLITFRFFARHAIANNKDTSRFEPGVIENLSKELKLSKD